MPDNLRIASFVLGSVLLLIAILGGNFRLFGAHIASTVSSGFLRLAAFVLGAVFLASTFYSSKPTNGTDSNSNSNKTGETNNSNRSNQTGEANSNSREGKQQREKIECYMKGTIYSMDDNNNPFPGVEVGYMSGAEFQSLAKTGTDGTFKADCSQIDAIEFPLHLALRWHGVVDMPKENPIPRQGREGINVYLSKHSLTLRMR